MAKRRQKNKRPLGTRLVAPGHNRDEEDTPTPGRARRMNHAAKGQLEVVANADRVGNKKVIGTIGLGDYRPDSLAARATVVGPDPRKDRLRRVRSEILAARDVLVALPPEKAIATLIAEYRQMATSRRPTEADRLATLYLAAEVVERLPVSAHASTLDQLAQLVGIGRDVIAGDMAELLRGGIYEERDPPPPPTPARARPDKPPHWRDALDGLHLIADYWQQQEALGTHIVPLLAYGWGWSTTSQTIESLMRERGLDGEAGLAEGLAGTKRIIARGVAEALPCYVAPPIVDLLEEAALTIPAATLTPGLLPARSGVFWFGRGINWRAHAEESEIARFVFSADDMMGAIASAEELGHTGLGTPTPQQLDAIRTAGTLDTRPDLRAIAWHPVVGRTASTTEAEERALFACYFDQHTPDGLPLEMFDFSCEVSFTIGYGQPINRGDDDLAIPAGSQFILDLLATTLRFLHQTILRPESRTVENKGARRRIEKQLGRTPPPVQIIRLREYADEEQGARADADAGGRTYSCRWLVRGHWHQYRVGPGRKKLEPRYVQPFVKGPADKEIRVKQKVMVASR